MSFLQITSAGSIEALFEKLQLGNAELQYTNEYGGGYIARTCGETDYVFARWGTYDEGVALLRQYLYTAKVQEYID